MLRYPYILLCLTLVAFHTSAQEKTILYTAVNLADLSAFKPGLGNWKTAKDVFYDFKEGGKTEIIAGQGILVNEPSENEKDHLFTVMEHGDIEMELDFMMNKNSNSGIYFQSRYELQLFDSWGVKQPGSHDCGAIYERWDESRPDGRKGYEGHPPAQNVSKAPGLWQHYKIYFRAPRFNEQGKKIENARFVKVIHNGVTIHENVEVTGPTRAAFFTDEKPTGPLMIQGDHGPVAIRNIKYKVYGSQSVTLSNLRLAAYEGKFNALPDFSKLPPSREMNMTALEHIGTESMNNFAGRISGTLHIPKSGSYYFFLNLKWIPADINPASPNGGGEFSIGNNRIFTIDGRKSGSQSTIIHLEAGEYPLVLSYYKSHKLWYVPTDDIMLAVEADGIPYTHLNASFKAVEAVGAIRVTVNHEPVMLRSFVNHKGIKRTHVISVGEPGGLNYSIDLSSGSFLQEWKGDFAETTLMWHGRGEPQLAVPLGSVLERTGKPSIAFLKDNTSQWPDSSAKFNYSGYDLDDSGRPVFKFELGDSEVKESFVAADNGKKLSHTISIRRKGISENVWCLAAEGNEIVKMPNGLYAVNKEFYIEIPHKQNVLLRKTSSNTTELLLPVSLKDDSGTVTYSIVW
jgi:hypothetical protein